MVTVEQLYKALRAHGASETQAAGIVGNSVSEVGPSTPDLTPDSELNPEYNEPGCIGLWCWEPEFFDPPRPTGDSAADMNNQVAYLKADGGFEHAAGSDATSAGRNFALNYERCAECYSGGLQYVRRGEQAAAVAALAAKYDWDKPPAPPKSMHYAKFAKGAERTAVERYDALRELEHEGKLTKQVATFLAERRKECGDHAKDVAAAAEKDKVNGKPSWDKDNRGWREQQLLARKAGKRVLPS